MKKHCLRKLINLSAHLALLTATSIGIAAPVSEHEIEQMFRDSVQALVNNNAEQSLQHLESLLAKQPEFRLAHAVYAELLTAYAHQNALLSLPTARDKKRIVGIKEETIARITYQPPPTGYMPENIMQLSNLHDYVLLLDASRSRLYIFQNIDNKPELIADYYAVIGKGGMGKTQENDHKTPVGVYHITDHFDGQQLPELYGAGAYPLNYPNAWDKLSSRSGYGIWLHGMPPDIYSRPPADSRGCIIVSNHLLMALKRYIKPGRTAIILTQNAKWLPAQQWKNKHRDLTALIHQWRTDWESMDTPKYLAHYSKNYRTETETYQDMVNQVKRNTKHKEHVTVEVENLDLFYYSDDLSKEAGIMTAIFDQNYRSNNYNTRYRKQQFWRTGHQGWEIIYAGRAESH